MERVHNYKFPRAAVSLAFIITLAVAGKVLGGAQLAAKPSLRLPCLKHTCPVAMMRSLTAETVRLKESQIKLSVSNFTATILQQQ